MDDARLSELRALVDSGRYDLLSLDYFDTLVTRRVPTPIDVFILVADELARRGYLFPSTSRESFVHERRRAERAARKRTRSGEVALDDIYREFPRGFLRHGRPEDVAVIECSLERSVIEPHPGMAAVLEHAKSAGLATAIVSDTYFNADQLREFADFGVDHVVTSSEENRSKVHGLHQILLERSGVAASRMLHVGDNHEADVDGPEALGIERFWFRQWPEAYETMLDLELRGPMSDRVILVQSHDAGLNATRRRAMFSAVTEYERWGAGVAGPVLAGFGAWIGARCRESGVDVALCLMREGELLQSILEHTAPQVDARKFFVSRYSARKAAVFEASLDELTEFLSRPSLQTRGELLADLGLDTAGIPGDPDRVLTEKERDRLLETIVGNPKYKRRAAAHCAAARAALLAHLDTVLDGVNPDTVAVVDLGYTGTIQQCLQKILDHEGRGMRTHGLYLVTGGNVGRTQDTGAPAEGWLADNGQPVSVAHTFMRSPEILEQSMMAPCGTTLGHDPDGTPRLDDFRCPDWQREQIAEIQRGILSFAKQWGDRETPDVMRSLFRAVCIRSVARPLPVELGLFGEWTHDENFGSTRSRGLVEVAGSDEWEHSHMSPHQLASLGNDRVYWPFGLASTISPTMGEAVAGIYLRSAEPLAFDAGHKTQYMVAYLDDGNGFRPDTATIQPYRLNNRGKVWQRFTLRVDGARPPQRVGFSIGLKDQVVHLAGISVRDAAAPVEGPSRKLTHEGVQKMGYTHLWGSLYRVEEDPALLVVPTEDLARDTRAIDVDLFFGVVLGE